jgi:NAD(P)-dependent dehydrogenase (short-subunit alcohol dehydrogenase family)
MIRPIDVNLAGRVALVTGASTGIGKEIARDLARLNARVILACRDEARGRAALDEIVADTGNHRTELRIVDVSSRASIASFAYALRASERELHVLVNNAGVWLDERKTSVDGVEMTWATNVLGYHVVSRELLPLLREGARPDRKARIVNVASDMARGLELDDVELKKRGYDGVTAYAQSKQADRMLTRALARRVAADHVTVTSMHPGWVATEIARDPGLKAKLFGIGARLFARSPAEGADTASWLAAATEVEGRTGGFYVDRRERPCRFADVEREERLWELCELMARSRDAQSTSSTTLPNPSLLAT